MVVSWRGRNCVQSAPDATCVLGIDCESLVTSCIHITVLKANRSQYSLWKAPQPWNRLAPISSQPLRFRSESIIRPCPPGFVAATVLRPATTYYRALGHNGRWVDLWCTVVVGRGHYTDLAQPAYPNMESLVRKIKLWVTSAVEEKSVEDTGVKKLNCRQTDTKQQVRYSLWWVWWVCWLNY